MGYSFDGDTKVISLSLGTTTFSVRDLWSRWVDWMADAAHNKYLPAFTVLGGDPIDVVAGTYVAVYLTLENGWMLKPQEADHTLFVTDGILVNGAGGSPFNNTDGSYNVVVIMNQPVQAIAFDSGGGGAGNPWSTPISGNTTAGTFGEVVGKKLLKTGTFIALK